MQTTTPATSFQTGGFSYTPPAISTAGYQAPAGPQVPTLNIPTFTKDTSTATTGTTGTTATPTKPVQPTGVPTSDPTKPSSSASVPLNTNAVNNTNTATTAASNGTTPQPNPNIATAQSLSTALQGSGYQIDASSIQGYLDAGMDANTATSLAINGYQNKQAQVQNQQAQANQQAQYNAALAQQNAQYAASSQSLAQNRSNAIDTATAQLASLNSSGGISSDSTAFVDHIGTMYDTAQNQLNLMAQQAQAALQSGNAQAYAAIQANMNNVTTQLQNNVSNILSSANAQKVAGAQFNAGEQDKAVTQFQSSLQNLPIDQSQALGAMPSDWGSMTPEQQKQIQNTSPGLFTQAQRAGYTPAQAWSFIQPSATGAYKQQAANVSLQKAQVAALTAQVNIANKQQAQMDAQGIQANGGQDYLSAIQNAQSGGKYSKDKVSNSLSAINDALTRGDTNDAKTQVVNFALSGGSATDARMYSTLQGLPAIMDKVTAAIKSLPADQQPGLMNGTFQNIAAKFGQNPSPQLQALASEMGHVQKNYITGVYGMRAASLQNDSIFTNLFPKGTDTASLAFSVAKGLVDTAKDTIDSQVQAKIGSDAFNNIFGSSTFGGTGAKSKSQGPVFAGYTQAADGLYYPSK